MKLFEDLPSTNTPINAENLNQIKDNLVVVSPTEPTGENREKVWMQQGSLYNSKNNTNGYYLDSLGVETANGAWDLTEYIQVKPNGNYEISGVTVVGTSPYCGYYDNNKNFISSFKNSNGIITMPTNAYYVRFSINGADITGFKFELCSKIYVKNDKDVYEEFISKDNLIDYSTGEQKIGTWIDGKPLYRKVVQFTTSSKLNSNIETGITNIENLVILTGMAKGIPINYYLLLEGVEYFSQTQFDFSTNKIIHSCSSTYADRPAYAIIEYTKTTD